MDVLMITSTAPMSPCNTRHRLMGQRTPQSMLLPWRGLLVILLPPAGGSACCAAAVQQAAALASLLRGPRYAMTGGFCGQE